MASGEEDYYALLGVEYGATEAELRKAYRKQALKCHPDKVGPDDKKAAHMFHLLSLAISILSDPVKRPSYDSLYATRIARKRKLDAVDSSLRAARQSLAEREAAALQRATTEFTDSVERRNEIDRIREEGMKKARAEEMQRTVMRDGIVEEAVATAHRERCEEQATVKDKTVRVRWRVGSAGEVGRESLEDLMAAYGPVANVVITKGKGKGMVEYESVFDAVSSLVTVTPHTLYISLISVPSLPPHQLKATTETPHSPHMHSFKVSWLGSSQPECLSEYGSATSGHPRDHKSRRHRKPESGPKTGPPSTSYPSTGAAAATFDDDYEMITLMKMREAAKAKAVHSQASDKAFPDPTGAGVEDMP
ncbi:hypothetical protein HKX48_005072 [Thoreauomyces humboldtii]|nr:hypothetical protein HKX48_005072 [Thoreauomyces humboldtii]